MPKRLLLALALSVLSSMALVAKPIELVTLDYPPYVIEQDGQLSGVAIELVESVFSELGVSISIEVLPWARALSNVQFGRSDAVFTAFKNPTREAFADYSQQVLFTQNISLVVKSGSPLNSARFVQSDVSDIAICAVNRVSYGPEMDTLLAERRFRTIFWRNKTTDCARLILAERADVWVNNDFGARSILASEQMETQLEILSPPIEATPSYIAFSKLRNQQALRDRFDQVLREMKQDGRYEALIDAYFERLRREHTKEKG